MAFNKGKSGNPAGRPKGSSNKVTAKLRESITDFLDGNFNKIKKDFKGLKPADRVKYYIELLQYAVPKLQSVQLETEFDHLSDDQLQTLVDELIKKVKSNSDE